MILVTDKEGEVRFETAVGEVLCFNGFVLTTVGGDGCLNCFFEPMKGRCPPICNGGDRADGKDVIYMASVQKKQEAKK